nr:hypothetical protein BaRGS_034828 [Batillaria attramentaria]
MLKIPSEQARLQWAQGHLNWNNVNWQNVLFSDESRFCIDHADGRVRGAIGHNQVLGPVIFQGLGPGRGNGITAQRYMDQTQLNRVVPRPTTVAELDRAVRQAWANIPRAASNTLVRSMTRRCQAVIDANGGHTRY